MRIIFCLDMDLKWPNCTLDLSSAESSEDIKPAQVADAYLDLIMSELLEKRSACFQTRSSHKLSRYIREIKQLRRIGWAVFRRLFPRGLREVLFTSLGQECKNSDPQRWGNISGHGKMSKNLFLDVTGKRLMDQFVDKILSERED